ncbi:MAG: hypothetical protein ABI036_11215 [Fibrobacteria bacterium]
MTQPTRNYCAIFDKNYLLQGLTLYRSLVRHEPNFRLYCLCMDAEAAELIDSMGIGNLFAVPVNSLETPEIAKARSRMTHGQFCWTCQPLVCAYLLEAKQLDMITYLEADSMFFGSAEPLYRELGSDSATIVPHRFSKRYDMESSGGTYCVQFNLFRNDARSREILDYWKKECYKYDKSRPGLYPGQVCLDYFTTRFQGVRVIENIGAGIAPWNVHNYAFTKRGDAVEVDGIPAIFFHYHEFSHLTNGGYLLAAHFQLPPDVIEFFYKPYIAELRATQEWINEFDPTFHYRKQQEDESTTFKALVKSKLPPDIWNFFRRKWKKDYVVLRDLPTAERS